MLPAIAAVRQMILDCHFWSNDRVFIDALPAPQNGNTFTASELTELRPFALLEQSGGDGWTARTASVAADCYIASGHISAQFEWAVPDDVETPHDMGVKILTDLGRVLWTQNPEQPGLLDLSGQPGRPLIRRITVGDYGRVPEKDVEHVGDYVAAAIDIQWGIDG